MYQNYENDRWWENTKLEDMSQEQWENLCDGCGRCCLIKVWHANRVKYAKVACQLMDIETARCGDYDNRLSRVKNCYKITLDTLDTPGLLPDTCAYKLIRQGKALYDWHHLISGSRDTVVEAGISIIGFAKANNEAISASETLRYMAESVDLDGEK